MAFRKFALIALQLVCSCITHGADAEDCTSVADRWCNTSPATAKCLAEIQRDHGTLPLVALRDTDSKGDAPLWRCYSPTCLDHTKTHYLNGSRCALYCTENSALEKIIRNCTDPPRPVQLVILDEAAERQGAVCLDGSPPAYYFRAGKNNSRSWIVEMEGGGWCFHDPPRLPEDVNCWYRAYGPAIESSTPPGYLGSSRMLPMNYSHAPPRGLNYLLSDDPAVNPEFHEFNTVFVHYCDGASFTGDASQPVKVLKSNGGFFRARNIAAIKYKLHVVLLLTRAQSTG